MYSTQYQDVSNWRFSEGRTYHFDVKSNQWRPVEFYGTAPNQWRYADVLHDIGHLPSINCRCENCKQAYANWPDV